MSKTLGRSSNSSSSFRGSTTNALTAAGTSLHLPNWTSGNGLISNSSGVDGDFYLDNTSPAKIYKRINGVWVEQCELTGAGIPTGGTTSQVLQKLSGTNYDTAWVTLGEVTGVTAGTNLNGGGTEGTVTLNLDTTLTGLSSVATTSLSLNGTEVTASATQLNYVDATSSIQTQLNTKQGVLSEGAFVNGDKTKLDGIATNAGAGTVNTGADGYLAYYDGAGTAVNDASGLYWDDVNSRLGIGTTSPNQKIQIAGSNDTDHLLIKLNSSSSSSQAVFGVEGDTGGTVCTGTTARAAVMAATASGSTLQLGSSGAVRATIDTSGNFGIGTTSPSNILHLKSATPQIYIQSNDGNDSSIVFGDASDASRGQIKYTSSDDLLFLNNNLNERMRIDSSGRVGIGRTPTSNALEVNGGISVAPDSGTSQLTFAGTGTAEINQYVNYSLTLKTNNTAAVTIDNSQRVGIGTTSPSTSLHVSGSYSSGATPYIRSEDTTSTGALIEMYATQASGAGYIQTGASTDIRFAPASSTKMLLKHTTGNLGLGTTSPTRKLDVVGYASIQDTSSERQLLVANDSSDVRLYARNRSDNSDVPMGFYTGVTERMRIDSSGNVGIGTASPSRLLHLSSSGGTFVRLDTGEGDDFSVGANSNGWSVYNETDSSYSLVVDGSGNVGIGTTSPSETLSVVGDGSFTKSAAYPELKIKRTGSYSGTDQIGNILFYADTDSVGGLGMLRDGADDAAALQFFTQATGGANSERMRIESDGNIHLPSDSTETLLKIDGNSSTSKGIRIKSENAGGIIYAANAGGIAALRFGVTADDSTITEAARFNASGRFGLGTTTPSGTCHIVSADSNVQLIVEGTGTNAPAKMNFKSHGTGSGIIQVQGTERMRIGSSGQLGIDGANYGTSGQVLTSNGSGSAPSWQTVSGSGDVSKVGTPASGQVGYWTGDGTLAGEDNLFWDATNDRLGVGVTSPDVHLHVKGTALDSVYTKLASISTMEDAGTQLRIENAGDTGGTTDIGCSLVFENHGNRSVSAIASTIGGTNKDTSVLSFWTHSSTEDAKQRMTINYDGNIGIGTTSPTRTLTVDSGSTDTVALFTSSGDARARIKIEDSTTTTAPEVSVVGNDLRLTTSDTDRLTIDSSGNVGIGTTAPASNYKLDVNGKAVVRDDFDLWNDYCVQYWKKANGTDTLGWILNRDDNSCQYVWADGQDLRFLTTTTGGSTTDRVRIDSSGNVKVGNGSTITASTDADDFIIDKGAADTGLSILSTTTGRLYFGDAALTDAGSIRYVHTDDSMRFETASTERMRINSTGLGIGTTSPTTGLEVAGGATISNTGWSSSATANSLVIDNNSGASRFFAVGADATTDGSYLFYTGQTDGGTNERMQISSTGQVGIGGTPTDGPLHIFNAHSGTQRSVIIENTAGGDASTQYEATGGSVWVSGLDNSDSDKFKISQNELGDVDRLTIDTGGNIGIGTASPSSNLHIYDSTINSSDILYLQTGADSVNDYVGIKFATAVGGSGPHAAIRVYGGPSAGDSYISLLTTSDGGTLAQGLTQDHIGNVGIGTTSPSSKLHVAGDALLADGKLLVTNTSGNTGAIYNGTSDAGDVRLTGGNAHNSGAGIVLYGGSHSATPDVAIFNTGSTERMRLSSTGLGIGVTPSYKLHSVADVANWGAYIKNENAAGYGLLVAAGKADGTTDAFQVDNVAGTTLMLLQGDGKLGIGTTSPSQTLHVEGEGYFSTASGGELLIDNNGASGILIQQQNGGATDSGSLNISSGTATLLTVNDAERMRIDSSGKVGIGTTSPSDALTVGDGTNSYNITINKSDAGTGALEFESAGTDKCYVRCNASEDLILGTGDSDRVSILAGGNVGVGTTSPSRELHVAGRLMLDDSNDGYIYLGSDSDQYIKGDAGSNWIGIYAGNSEKFKITSDGALGIGGANYGTSGQVLTSNGNGSAVTWSDVSSGGGGGEGGGGDPSDSRLKENVKEIKALDNINRLRPVEFDWNELANEEAGEEGHSFGLIAQEVEEIYPHLVKEKDSGYKNLNYRMLTPLLVQSDKELTEENKSLRARLDAIEQKVQSL